MMAYAQRPQTDLFRPPGAGRSRQEAKRPKENHRRRLQPDPYPRRAENNSKTLTIPTRSPPCPEIQFGRKLRIAQVLGLCESGEQFQSEGSCHSHSALPPFRARSPISSDPRCARRETAIPRTRKWPPDTVHAGIACATSRLGRTAEFCLPTIRFTALSRCRCPGRSSFTRDHANGLETMPAFLKTFVAIG